MHLPAGEAGRSDRAPGPQDPQRGRWLPQHRRAPRATVGESFVDPGGAQPAQHPWRVEGTGVHPPPGCPALVVPGVVHRTVRRHQDQVHLGPTEQARRTQHVPTAEQSHCGQHHRLSCAVGGPAGRLRLPAGELGEQASLGAALGLLVVRSPQQTQRDDQPEQPERFLPGQEGGQQPDRGVPGRVGRPLRHAGHQQRQHRAVAEGGDGVGHQCDVEHPEDHDAGSGRRDPRPDQLGHRRSGGSCGGELRRVEAHLEPGLAPDQLRDHHPEHHCGHRPGPGGEHPGSAQRTFGERERPALATELQLDHRRFADRDDGSEQHRLPPVDRTPATGPAEHRSEQQRAASDDAQTVSRGHRVLSSA